MRYTTKQSILCFFRKESMANKVTSPNRNEKTHPSETIVQFSITKLPVKIFRVLRKHTPTIGTTDVIMENLKASKREYLRYLSIEKQAPRRLTPGIIAHI